MIQLSLEIAALSEWTSIVLSAHIMKKAALWIELINVMEAREAISKAELRVDEVNESVEIEVR
jgi:hypothetical protein